MSVPPFVLSPVTADDVESMIAVYEAAFASNPLSSLLFPKSIKPEVKAAWLRKRFLGYLAKPEIRQFKVTETSTGKLVAWSRWAFPYVLSPEEKEKRRKEEEEKAQKDPKESYPDGANVGACEEKFNGFDEFRRTWVDDENMYRMYPAPFYPSSPFLSTPKLMGSLLFSLLSQRNKRRLRIVDRCTLFY